MAFSTRRRPLSQSNGCATEPGLESAYKPDSVFVRRFVYAANPEARRAGSMPPYLALLLVGFAKPPQLLAALVRSYRTVSPSPFRAVCFLLHFPSGRPAPDCPGHHAL